MDSEKHKRGKASKKKLLPKVKVTFSDIESSDDDDDAQFKLSSNVSHAHDVFIVTPLLRSPIEAKEEKSTLEAVPIRVSKKSKNKAKKKSKPIITFSDVESSEEEVDDINVKNIKTQSTGSNRFEDDFEQFPKVSKSLVADVFSRTESTADEVEPLPKENLVEEKNTKIMSHVNECEKSQESFRAPVRTDTNSPSGASSPGFGKRIDSDDDGIAWRRRRVRRISSSDDDENVFTQSRFLSRSEDAGEMSVDNNPDVDHRDSSNGDCKEEEDDDDTDDPGSLEEFVVSDSFEEEGEEEAAMGEISLIAEAEMKAQSDERKNLRKIRNDRNVLWKEEGDSSDNVEDESEGDAAEDNRKRDRHLVPKKERSRKDRRSGFQDRSNDDDTLDVEIIASGERSSKLSSGKPIFWSSDSEVEHSRVKSSAPAETTSKKPTSVFRTSTKSSSGNLSKSELQTRDSEDEGSFQLNSIRNDRGESVSSSPTNSSTKTPKISKTYRAPIVISSESDDDDKENSSRSWIAPAPSSAVRTRFESDVGLYSEEVFDDSTNDGLPTPPFPRIRPKSLEDRTNVVTPSQKPVTANAPKTAFVPRVKPIEAQAGRSQLSFLASLSQVVPTGKTRNPEAERFVFNFKKLKNELTQNLFILLNKTVFDTKLPSDLPITWNKRLLKTAGYCKYKKASRNSVSSTVVSEVQRLCEVELSEKILDSAERTRDTLLHELCHAAVWIVHGVNEGHGRFWQFYGKKATFVHRDIPLVTRCHSYAIATKFLYVCQGCGYSIGRHSKSLDTKAKICGKCHGTFECRKNLDYGAGGTPRASASTGGLSSASSTPGTSTPATPRTPNKFALFVKDNYASAKKENRELKHGDIMKLLGKEFAVKMKV